MVFVPSGAIGSERSSPPADGAGHNRLIAKDLGHYLCGFRVRCKSSKDGILTVINDKLCPFLSVVRI